MSNKKGLLIQILGLPNSGKSSRSRYLAVNLIEKFELQNFGNLGGLSIPEIVKKPWIFYEFGLISVVHKKYEINELIKENKAKLKDEFEIYEELFNQNIKPYLNQREIIIGYNPMIQNAIHRLKVLYPDNQNFEKIEKKIEKLHKNHNTIDIYLDSTPSQVIERQPTDYQTKLATENVLNEIESSILLGKLGITKEKKKKLNLMFEEEINANKFLKDVYQTSEVIEYLSNARNALNEYSENKNIITMKNQTDPETQNEMLLEHILKTIEDQKIYLKQPKSL